MKDGQITFRTTQEILSAIERLSKERKVSKGKIINDLLEAGLGIKNVQGSENDFYKELDKKIESKLDEKIEQIRIELEQAVNYLH